MSHACMQSKAPTPSNEAVFLSQAPAFEAYVASYSGWNSDKKFTKVASELFEELRSAGVDVREDMYYTAGYDSPFRLINRHNEVRTSTARLLELHLSDPCFRPALLLPLAAIPRPSPLRAYWARPCHLCTATRLQSQIEVRRLGTNTAQSNCAVGC